MNLDHAYKVIETEKSNVLRLKTQMNAYLEKCKSLKDFTESEIAVQNEVP